MKKSFEEWMNDVDFFIRRKVGLTHLDLPYCCYRDWYDDKVRPSTAANRAVKNSFD